MQLELTVPLNIKTEEGKSFEFLPVRMDFGFPSTRPSLWAKFQEVNSIRAKRYCVSDVDCDRIQAYMKKHNTEALSEDGETAFSITGGWLIRCNPEVCMVQ